MERPLAHLTLRACGWSAVLLGAMLTTALAAAAQPADPSTAQDAHQLQEVQVTAPKLDRRTLKRVAIQFVKLHGAVSPVIHQIGRWRTDMCLQVRGLDSAASAYVSRRVTEVARSVGAPTRRARKKCQANVEVVFTSQPQQLLNHIAKAYPDLLGSSRSAGDTLFRRAVQSWYTTATRETGGMFRGSGPLKAEMMIDAQTGQVPLPDGAYVDPAHGQPATVFGLAGSRFTKGVTSEIVQVLVIADANKVAGHSLRSISDYIAMLALTRMGSLDGCSELPSIIDLLSSGCDEREKAQALTDADTAYLRALYSSDLEMNLNIEQGDMRDRMVAAIKGR
jgi:hypothetical protein